MNLEQAFLGLLAFTLIREFWFMRQVNKLVDKIMCKSLHEYELARGINKRKIPQAVEKEEDMYEDLGALQGIV